MSLLKWKLKVNGGQIFLNSLEITHQPMYIRAKEGISYLPQEASIFRKLTVEDNIKAILETRKNLSNKEKIMTMDKLLEEFGIIDPIAVNEIKDIIIRLSNKGIGVLITDHNVRDTLEITNRSYIINLGEILAEGSQEELLANPLAREIYLGKDFRM